MTPEQRDKKLDLIKNQCRILMDSFDTVQIFATKFEPEPGSNTAHYQHGNGNWFARYGHVRGWLLAEEQEFKNIDKKEST